MDEFAVLDAGRLARKGVPEIVYAPGKTPEQTARICEALLEVQERVIVSAPSPEHEAAIRRGPPRHPRRSAGRALVVGSGEPPASGGRVGRDMRRDLGRAGPGGGRRRGPGDGRGREDASTTSAWRASTASRVP